jgi:protease secretion system outer membrane protein
MTLTRRTAMARRPARAACLAAFAPAALLVAMAAALLTPDARAVGFAQAWQASQQADPQYRAARADLEANRFAIPIARSQLLPQVGASIADSRINGTRESTLGTSLSTPLDYTSRSRSLSVRVPVLNVEAMARLRSGQAQVAYAEAAFRVRGKDLVARMGKAYFELLYALDTQALAQSAVETYTEAVAYATRRFKSGEGTRTEIGEAEARLDIAAAQLIEARDAVEVARRTLQVISGLDAQALRPPGSPLPVAPVAPATIDPWLSRVDSGSPEVAARRLLVESARRDVDRARSGHYPRVDAVASVSQLENDTINTLNTRIRQNAIGLQVNIPIYSGGYVDATTEQALMAVRKAEEELDAELNAQRIELRRQFLAAGSSLARVEALAKAVRSSEIALEGTRFGLRAGLRTNLDVLDATRQLFQARRDLQQARYGWLQSVLQLRAVAGDPLDEIVADIDRMLMAAR